MIKPMHGFVSLMLLVLAIATDAHAAAPVSSERQAPTATRAANDASIDDGIPLRRRGPRDTGGIRWSQLSANQRQVLAPLREQWNRMPVKRQQRMAARAQDWAQLPPQRRQTVSDHIQRWASMDRDQRQQAMRGADRFRDLPEADRKRLMETWQRYQSLPPEQRRELMQRWREQHKDGDPRGNRPPDRPMPAQSADNQR